MAKDTNIHLHSDLSSRSLIAHIKRTNGQDPISRLRRPPPLGRLGAEHFHRRLPVSRRSFSPSSSAGSPSPMPCLRPFFRKPNGPQLAGAFARDCHEKKILIGGVAPHSRFRRYVPLQRFVVERKVWTHFARSLNTYIQRGLVSLAPGNSLPFRVR